jgi:5-formyltetrahydrofolate cyclo-ligase
MTKAALRRELLAARSRRSDGGPAAAAFCARVLTLPEVRAARTVAAYVSVGTEPGTRALLDALSCDVLLPVLRSDHDLDWARYDGSLIDGPHGLLEPARPRLGISAVSSADVVVVPALAVDRAGRRLGRGGGSYDRVLGRAHGWTVALIYDDELLDLVPTDAHDRPVDAVVTPSSVVRFSQPASAGR